MSAAAGSARNSGTPCRCRPGAPAHHHEHDDAALAWRRVLENAGTTGVVREPVWVPWNVDAWAIVSPAATTGWGRHALSRKAPCHRLQKSRRPCLLFPVKPGSTNQYVADD
jgi:hypothetical protein